MIGVQQLTPREIENYGIVHSKYVSELDKISHFIEKPKLGEVPSTLGEVGRYVLTPRIFHHLALISKGFGGEIQS